MPAYIVTTTDYEVTTTKTVEAKSALSAVYQELCAYDYGDYEATVEYAAVPKEVYDAEDPDDYGLSPKFEHRTAFDAYYSIHESEGMSVSGSVLIKGDQFDSSRFTSEEEEEEEDTADATETFQYHVQAYYDDLEFDNLVYALSVQEAADEAAQGLIDTYDVLNEILPIEVTVYVCDGKECLFQGEVHCPEEY